MQDYLNHILEFFPDRLAGEKWLQHCRFEGLGQLQSARRQGLPVVLAFCHFGPYYLLRFWLRAAGIPVATSVGGESKARLKLMQFKDRYSPFPEIPLFFYQNQLREMTEFVAAGNPLLIAIDAPHGKQISLPFCQGWNFQMATGAMRLAMHHRAELIPCSITDEGGWRFNLKLGRPVPREYLTGNTDWSRAGKHLLDEMIPLFRARPEQCGKDVTRCLRQIT